jgi:hypothetical protein
MSLRMREAGSRTLNRFGVVDEQIYLVIRDDQYFFKRYSAWSLVRTTRVFQPTEHYKVLI